MLETLNLLYCEDNAIAAIYILTVKYHREDDKWLGECIELGTATFAETLEEVRQELNEAIALQVNDMDQLGFAREYLADHGVQALPITESLLTSRGYVTVGATA